MADINDVHSAGFGQVAKSGILPTGRVVAVLRRNKRPYVATILQRFEPGVMWLELQLCWFWLASIECTAKFKMCPLHRDLHTV